MELGPRRIRPVSPPLAGYFRPGWNDHTVILQVISERMPRCLSGILCDPSYERRHGELWKEAARGGVETVLDTRAMELATSVGLATLRDRVPWSSDHPHQPEDFDGALGKDFSTQLAAYISHRPISAVLSPTHFILGSDDPWLAVDARLSWLLREALDATGSDRMPIYYPLALPAAQLRNPAIRRRLIAHLSALPVDALWLRLSPFGSRTSGGVALRGYLDACRDLRSLGLPLVAERTGTLGVALLAFGATGGIESGVTTGENFDFSRFRRPREGGAGYSPPPRVYMGEIMSFLSPAQAEELLQNRTLRSQFACQGHWCCTQGVKDMVRDPRRHFLARRLGEISGISELPPQLRPRIYMEDALRPATDLVTRASSVLPALLTSRDRLERWRYTLGSILKDGTPDVSATVPQGERLRLRVGA